MKIVVTTFAVGCLLASNFCRANSHHELDAFNEALRKATFAMNDDALAALWENDGISLLPDTAPLVRKQAITKFMMDVNASLPGARMHSFELQCHDPLISGEWASEWCHEHQIVALPDGKSPFDGAGNLLLILHKSADGKWRLRREMWNHQ